MFVSGREGARGGRDGRPPALGPFQRGCHSLLKGRSGWGLGRLLLENRGSSAVPLLNFLLSSRGTERKGVKTPEPRGSPVSACEGIGTCNSPRPSVTLLPTSPLILPPIPRGLVFAGGGDTSAAGCSGTAGSLGQGIEAVTDKLGDLN